MGGMQNVMVNHMTEKSLGGGKKCWVLSAGEVNLNSLVSLADPNRVTLTDLRPGVANYGYDLRYDVNLDGCVDWPWSGTNKLTDWKIVDRNRGKYSEIRWLDNK